MRQIQFRGQEIGSKKWVEGFYFEDEYSNSYMIYGSKTWQVYPETVGQYTGLKDKNGVKIFEGDVVKYSSGAWTEHTQKVTFNNGYFSPLVKVEEGYNCIDKYYESSFEVIGNIHDNPELLE